MYSKWIDLLLKNDLFNNITKAELTTMLTCFQPRITTYKPKEYINIEKDGATEIGIILEGEVAVIKDNFAGDRVILQKLKKGDIFGAVTAFSNRGQLSTLDPTVESTILFLPSNYIVGICPKFCSGHEMLIRNMLEIISRKAITLNKKVELLSLKTIRGRISNYLLQQYKEEQSLTFTIPLKRYELAEFLNTPRPSLSRELKHMKEDGIIDFYKNSFRIINLNELKKSISA